MTCFQWAEQDSNLRRRQPEDLQSSPFATRDIDPNSQADEGTRTHNQTFTKRLLCQLSYIGLQLLPISKDKGFQGFLPRHASVRASASAQPI